MSDYITFEIQEEIIRWLPVRSLLQFRSVSKSWKALIDSAKFIAAYSIRQNQPHHILTRYEHTEETRYICFVDDGYFPQQRSFPTVPLFREGSAVVGSSGGLLCLYGEYVHPDNLGCNEMAVLWNPSIRKSVAIERSNASHEVFLGFGVCPVTNDPTIVKITYQIGKNIINEVYTLSSKNWRSLSCNLPRPSVEVRWEQVVVDKLIYLLALDFDTFGTSYTIISFDMTSHEFGEVYLPDSLARSYNIQMVALKVNLTISKLWESLAVLEYIMETDTRICAVWTESVSKSFTKLFTIRTPYASMTTIGFNKSGEPLNEFPFESDPDYAWVGLVGHQPYTEHNLGIFALCDSLSMHSYMETLLLLNQ